MRAIVIEMVAVGPDPNPIWWRGVASPAPASWAYVFEDFTGDDTAESWALAAAVVVAQTRAHLVDGAADGGAVPVFRCHHSGSP
ncbi:hypothetical protein [Microbacterium shaanxiense]